MKKYRLTDVTIDYAGHTLHRIEALTAFGEVKCGDIGGFVENEKNLSHCGRCWIYDNAKVFGNAHVCDNAKIFDTVRVFNDAVVCDNAKVFDRAMVFENAKVFGRAMVFDNAVVCDNAKVYDNANVQGCSKIRGFAEIYDNAEVLDMAEICGGARIGGDVIINEARSLSVSSDAVITSDEDYVIFKNFWSSGRYFVWTKSDNMWNVGCFHGTGEELIAKAYKDSEKSGREYERVVRYVESILKDYNYDREKIFTY